MISKEEFKDTALNILLNEKFGNLGVLFDTENIDRYKVAQYDEDEWSVESDMPLSEFLDDFYNELERI